MIVFIKNKSINISFNGKPLGDTNLGFSIGLNSNGNPAIVVGDKEVSKDHPLKEYVVINVSPKLQTIEPLQSTNVTVTLKSESGTPLPNINFYIGEEQKTTDSNGQYVYEYSNDQEGSYTFSINVPESSSHKSASDSFAINVSCPTGMSVKYDGTWYPTLKDAVENFTESTTFKSIDVLKDCSSEGIGLWLDDGKSRIRFNFHGHTVTFTGPAVGSSGTQTQAIHIEQYSTGEARDIEMLNGTIKSTQLSESNIKMLIQNYANVSFTNIVLDGSGLNDGNRRYVLSNNFGATVLNNCTINAGSGNVAFDSWFGNAASGVYDSGVSVLIKGNTNISGDVEYGAATAAVTRVSDWTTKNNISIESGSIVGNLVNSCASSTGFVLSDANVVITGGTQTGEGWDQVR